MMRGCIVAMAASCLIFLGAGGRATAATFEVVEENGGPTCWIRAKVSEYVSLSLFADQGSKSDELTILVEDEQTDPEAFKEQADTFPITITLESGNKLSFSGFYDEELAGPVANAKLSEIRKIANQRNWKLAIENTPPVKADDVVAEELFKKFIACSNR